MMQWIRTKALIPVVALVTVLILSGAGAVLAAQHRGDLFASNNNASSASGAHSDAEQEFHAHGMILGVLFDQGSTNSGSLTFQADGQQATVNVLFSAQTRIEAAGALQPNTAAQVEGTMQSDGSVVAKEITADAANDAQNGENDNEPEDQTVPGTVQSVDSNAQTFVFLPDGKTDTMTIAFDSQTNMEQEHGSSLLVAGKHVVVEIVKRADGSLYAKEVKGTDGTDGDNSGQNDGGDHGGSSGSGGGSSDDGGPGH